MTIVELSQMPPSVESQLATHIAVCDLRYQNIHDSLSKGEKRMQRIEYLMYAMVAIIFLGPGFAAKLLEKLLGN
jgi:hypothetical protein